MVDIISENRDVIRENVNSIVFSIIEQVHSHERTGPSFSFTEEVYYKDSIV